jgi:hypothetical protein
MILTDVMDAVATRLDTIAGLRVFEWPQGSVTPPAAVVSYPETYTYDETYGRGMDRMTLPVIVVVGRPTDRSTRDRLGGYVNGTGAASVKSVLQSGTYTAFHTVRVVGVEFDVVTIGGTDYMGALFSLDIAGSGA